MHPVKVCMVGVRNDAAAPSPLDVRLAWIAFRAQQKFGIAAIRQSGYRKQKKQARQDRQSLTNRSSFVLV